MMRMTATERRQEMKKNKIRAVLLTMAAVFFVTIGSSVTAYANVPDDADDGGSVEVIFSDTEDTEEVSENDIPEETEDDESGEAEGILTPEGNLTLVDDIDEEHSDSLQYMTVQTRNGNYFYLIVDRSGNSDNVYFLNMVDESDLLQILSEEDQELIDQINHKEDKEEEKPVLIDDMDTDEPEEEIQDTGSRMKSSIPTLLIFLVIGGIVAGAYYFLKIKPNKNQPQYDEDMEFYDDEDYINEDEEYLDEEDTEAGEDADDSEENPEDVLDDDFQFLNFDDAGVDPDL